jgi:aminoglycoside 6'-N-acetyltransferase
VRPLTEADTVLLSCWLSDPEVAQYYEGRDKSFDLESVRATFDVERAVAEGVRQGIVELEGAPIGYLQYYPVPPSEAEEYGYALDANLWGMDLFIGETNHWNRGIGTELVRATIEQIVRYHAPLAVVIDPQVSNRRAIRCYEKAGFRIARRLPGHELHEGEWRDCWLMVAEPLAPKGPRVATLEEGGANGSRQDPASHK